MRTPARQFRLPDATLDQIDELRRLTGASSRAEVLRQAVHRWHGELAPSKGILEKPGKKRKRVLTG